MKRRFRQWMAAIVAAGWGTLACADAGVMVESSRGMIEAPPLVANLCLRCHAFKEGVSAVAPSLRGIYGRKATLAGGGWIWDTEHLSEWLTRNHGGPQAAVKAYTDNPEAETAMHFRGVASPEDIERIVDFLKGYR